MKFCQVFSWHIFVFPFHLVTKFREIAGHTGTWSLKSVTILWYSCVHVIFYMCVCRQHWCTPSCSETWLLLYSECTPGGLSIRPSGVTWRTSLPCTRSQKNSNSACRTTSRRCGHSTMVSTCTRSVMCVHLCIFHVDLYKLLTWNKMKYSMFNHNRLMPVFSVEV